MSYELSAIEWEIHPRQIQKYLSEFTKNPALENKKNQDQDSHGKKIQPSYFLIERFKKLFTKEFHRVRISIQNHRIKDTEEDFLRYIGTNYKGLLRLRQQNTIKNNQGNARGKDTANQKITKQINFQLQKLFIKPLLTIIETDFKKELVTARLINSPIDTFLKELKNNRVAVIKHNNYAVAEYNPIYSNIVNRQFTLKYNNFNIEALYVAHFEALYSEFTSFIESSLENTPGYFNKSKLLNSLKEKISTVNEFFCEDPDSSNFHYEKLKCFRIDACNNLKLKLHKSNILNEFEKFNQFLTPLTDVQKIYITKSLKFIKVQLNLLEINRNEKEVLDHQEQVPSNQLRLALNDTQETTEKLQWRGNINQLITFFYDATTQVLVDGAPILNATKKQIVRLLTQNFVQKDGDPINPATINTIFTPSKELKRPPLNKRITFPAN